MACDAELADRIRFLIGAEPGLSEKKMFGGLDGDGQLAEWVSRAVSPDWVAT